MKLLTKEILRKLPALHATGDVPLDDKLIVLKLFTPWRDFTWYIAEYDPESGLMFGYATGVFENEWGYISLPELQGVIGPAGLRIERDRWFKPVKFSELKKKKGL
jgi:Protein of unknown function (DUF2958)